ncbi:DUF2381 family protein [Myxococcus fulvus]|nr:DUF2381 family protein [Myxococcus fulvus]MCK8503685.1 DUF2381 family protein [Myxococcus fulvus]
MLQPVRLALALVLFWGAAPRADAAPGRTKRERPVAVVGNPAEPLPEIRVEAATPTWLLFPTEIAKSTLTVDGLSRTVDKVARPVDESRIRIVDVGERSIIVQAVEDLRPGERHELAVFFADGRAPARAAFVLVTDPAEVDARIDVERREPQNATCPEVPRDPPRPEDFVLLGYVSDDGVQTDTVAEASDADQGLSSRRGVSYRGKGWVLVDVNVENSAGQQPWTPREATLTGKRGGTLPARLVTVDGGKIAPGNQRRVLAVADPPPPAAGAVFALQIRGDGGRTLTIPRVRFQGPLTGVNQ